MDSSEELVALGFSTNEATVYSTLLRIGRSQAGRLAKECALERTSTYNALKQLIQKGLVSYVMEGKARVFAAAQPEKILDFYKEKEEQTKLLIPKLQNLAKFEREKENILRFRGNSGVKVVFADLLNTCKYGEEYLIFGSENQLREKMPVYAKIYVARKDAKKLRARILVREGLKGKKMSKYTKAKYVPKNVKSPASVNVYGNKVSVILWSHTPEAIIIENKEAAETFKAYFEFMWKNAKA